MITKEELKKEVDKIPENLLEEAYALLKSVIGERRKTNRDAALWNKWTENLENFSSDFMINRDQTAISLRESFD